MHPVCEHYVYRGFIIFILTALLHVCSNNKLLGLDLRNINLLILAFYGVPHINLQKL